jgi:uncharacterized protein (TIGR02594 family)
MPIALGELGVLEDARPGRTNPRIVEYHAVTRGGSSSDDVPWCSSFVAWAMEAANVPSTRSKTAASWATWGEPCYTPVFGAVVVFGKRDQDAVGSGHVALYMGDGPNGTCYVLGGNQQNCVSIATRKRADVVAFRMPRTSGNLAG